MSFSICGRLSLCVYLSLCISVCVSLWVYLSLCECLSLCLSLSVCVSLCLSLCVSISVSDSLFGSFSFLLFFLIFLFHSVPSPSIFYYKFLVVLPTTRFLKLRLVYYYLVGSFIHSFINSLIHSFITSISIAPIKGDYSEAIQIPLRPMLLLIILYTSSVA